MSVLGNKPMSFRGVAIVLNHRTISCPHHDICGQWEDGLVSLHVGPRDQQLGVWQQEPSPLCENSELSSTHIS